MASSESVIGIGEGRVSAPATRRWPNVAMASPKMARMSWRVGGRGLLAHWLCAGRSPPPAPWVSPPPLLPSHYDRYSPYLFQAAYHPPGSCKVTATELQSGQFSRAVVTSQTVPSGCVKISPPLIAARFTPSTL